MTAAVKSRPASRCTGYAPLADRIFEDVAHGGALIPFYESDISDFFHSDGVRKQATSQQAEFAS
jgi:hypothetical protein